VTLRADTEPGNRGQTRPQGAKIDDLEKKAGTTGEAGRSSLDFGPKLGGTNPPRQVTAKAVFSGLGKKTLKRGEGRHSLYGSSRSARGVGRTIRAALAVENRDEAKKVLVPRRAKKKNLCRQYSPCGDRRAHTGKRKKE